jgi:hypothetical protein
MRPLRSLATLALALAPIALLLAGCGRSPSPVFVADPAGAQPAPTISAAFSPQAPTLVPPPTLEPGNLQPARPSSALSASDDPQIKQVSVYRAALDANWSLANSSGMTYDLKNTQVLDKERYALKAQPSLPFGTLYFTLNRATSQVFRRDQVLGLSFRLSGGAAAVAADALAVAVVGSNAQPYWVPNDRSVTFKGRDTIGSSEPIFSETRLYFLNINRDIPAKTWVDVVVWLDDRIYDPNYTYVTGFYLKVDRQLLPAYYIDRVSLLLKADGR